MAFKLVESGWDRVIRDAVGADHSILRIVCPFIKKQAAARLLRAGRPGSIRVITRFHLGDFCDGVSDTSALRLLLDSGAQIRGVRNLHAKVYLIGKRAIVTSANLTEAALSRNYEFGLVADDPDILKTCAKYFENLWRRSGRDLTVDRLDGWEQQLAGVLAAGSRPSRPTGLTDEGADAGVPPAPIILPPRVAEAPQSFVKFFGTSADREDRDTSVFDEVDRSGCHWSCTYPKGKRPRQVEDGALMFTGRLVGGPNDTMIFGRAVAMEYQEGRDDATSADIAMRKWRAQWPHYIRVHHAEFVAGVLSNGISLSQLMDELGANAFAVTQLHASRGAGSTNPRTAYRQQAAVRLSNEGYEWLNTRLEEAFAKHGKLAPAQLERLDWPETPTQARVQR